MKQMQNKKKSTGKKLCILFMVLFTLVLAADVANYFLTPAQMAFAPGGFDRGENFEMPEGMELPEGIAQGEGDFQRPAMDLEEGEPPSRENRLDREIPENRGGGQSSILQTLRVAWLPIAIVCALGDMVCLFLYLRIRWKEKALEEAFGGASGMPPLFDEEEEDPDEPPKRKKGPWAGIVCMVVAFAMILAMFPTEDGQTSSADVHSEVISGTAEAAQIHTVLSGAGTLEADTLTAVTVPQQVTVLKYHVRNGETVSAGDPLVSVDKTSASAAMMELDDILDDLDADLEAERQSSPSSYIYSTAAGRVKKIYAQEGTKVTDALYEHGALMLLSLDGLMKVSFESDENLTVGDTVTVKYSGGTEEGRIATVRQGKVTVTLSDETAWYGADVTVLDEGGKTLGTGKLEINSELKVIGYYGTVKSLSVSLNSKVSVGTTLMTLENTGYTTDYQILLARRSELEEQMQKLSQLAQTGMVYAENDGIVSGVPDDAEIELLSTGESGWKLTLLSVHIGSASPTEETQPTTAPEETIATLPTDPADLPLPEETTAPTEPEAPTTPTTPVTPTEPETPALNGTYGASYVASSGGKLYLFLTPTAVTEEDMELTMLENQMTQFGAYASSGIGDIVILVNGETQTVQLGDLQRNDLLLLTFTDGVITQVLKAQRPAAQQTNPSQGGQLPGGETAGAMPGTSGGMLSGSGMAQQERYEQYIVKETELLYVSDQEEIALTITVDELDILSLEEGLTAQVTLDAMKGQSFTGQIARIGHEGTNDGGNTKFSVTVTLPREAAMLDGMNAAVKFITATSDAAVSIPAAALVEDDGKTYVYTTYDEKTDTLGGLAEVQTGASDGELVEILSGLNVGDTFYYRYADTVTYSFLTNL